MTTAPLPLISVCVCTYHRPALLGKLLASLATQRTGSRFEIEVVVVDNDHAASARPVVEVARSQFPQLRLNYAVEPAQGISHARNHAVALASGDYLAFIDDDEKAGPAWLAGLFATLQDYRADAVLGPVIPEYPENTANWIVAGRFFERPRHPTGTSIEAGEGRTGNALIRRRWLGAKDARPFDEALAHTGGEDYNFFRRIGAQGAHLVWCDTAGVTELVPTERQSIAFLLKTRLRSSITYWQLNYAQLSRVAIARQVLIGCVGFLLLGASGIFLMPFSLVSAMKFWTKSMGALGRVAALTNIKPVGYGPA